MRRCRVWRDLLQQQSSILTLAVKASPAFVRLSLSPGSKRPLASYTVERKLKIREFTLCHSQYSYQQITDAFGMPQLALLQARVRVCILWCSVN